MYTICVCGLRMADLAIDVQMYYGYQNILSKLSLCIHHQSHLSSLPATPEHAYVTLIRALSLPSSGRRLLDPFKAAMPENYASRLYIYRRRSLMNGRRAIATPFLTTNRQQRKIDGSTKHRDAGTRTAGNYSRGVKTEPWLCSESLN